jgi:hypothetical protein
MKDYRPVDLGPQEIRGGDIPQVVDLQPAQQPLHTEVTMTYSLDELERMGWHRPECKEATRLAEWNQRLRERMVFTSTITHRLDNHPSLRWVDCNLSPCIGDRAAIENKP